MSTELIEQNEEKKPAKEEFLIMKPEEEKFCRLYLEGKSGLAAYAEAKGMNIKDDVQAYGVAAVMATKWLKRVKIGKRLNQLMTLAGFNDEGMDKELNFLAHQHNDYKAKLGAIKEYNTLKNRTNKGSTVFSGNTFNLAQILQRANEPA